VQVDPASRSSIAERAYPELRDADQWHDKWIVLANNQLHSSSDAADQNITPPREDLAFCAQLDSSAVVASRNGNIWRFQDHEFSPIETGKSGQLLDMSAGKGDTIGLHFQNSKAEQSVWQKWLDRSITPFRYFDVKNGQVVPVQERTESPTVSIQLAENPLENGSPGSLSLAVIADETGAWISTSDGLPLVQIAKTKNIVQAKWAANGVDGLRIFVSDASVVEEYRVTGLKNLFRFDAGSFD
jgi:hypothetical protein